MNPQYNSGYGGGYPQGNAPQYDSYDQQGGGSAASYYSGGQQQQHHQQQSQYGEEYPPQGQQHGYGQQQEYGGQPPQYAQQQHQGGNRDEQFPGQQPGQEGADGERGFLGALGGGVAGAWGGHKLGGRSGHGTLSAVLGAVAGAVAGSKLQDGVSDWRHERHDEKEREEEERRRREEEQRRYDQQQFLGHHGGPGGPPPPPFGGGPPREMSRGFDGGSYGGGGGGGNFSASSEDIRLEPYGEYMLHASCRRADGSFQSSSISLNRILENDQGRFRWSSSSGRGGYGGGRPDSVTVQPGDTLRDIAARHGVGFEEIARHNGIQNPDMIYPGQVLQVPNGGGYGGYGGGGGGGNFGASARDVRLVDGGRVLEGELLRDGGWERSHIRLDERIGNENGTLEFV